MRASPPQALPVQMIVEIVFFAAQKNTPAATANMIRMTAWQ
ncbi:hypothetical protein D1BOALGB6SA_7858 [Olavius sp. associated proteobacterium Delta 1]|nr:hypothetical protein D1BOALGB6SA_7858 [Olavius sp. associated proteobacterium Delta 1]